MGEYDTEFIEKDYSQAVKSVYVSKCVELYLYSKFLTSDKCIYGSFFYTGE